MRLPSLLLPLALCGAACSMQATAATETAPRADPIAAAIADPARSDADRSRDSRDHPAAVLALAGFRPGMTVADIFGGGGYYSEILSRVVGPQGHVLLVNNPPYDAYAKKGIAPRLAGGRLANVDYRIVPTTAMDLGTSQLDGALIVMSYHDLYVADPDQGWPAIDASQFIDQVATALKPGAVLLIVDHAARVGSGKADAQGLHRIDEAYARADFESHGFDFVARSDVLRNPDDDHDRNVFDAAIKGRTDRFVHVYRKR